MLGFSFGDPDEPRSEGSLVAELAARIGLTPHFIPSASGRVLTEFFDATLAAQDAPFPSASIVAQYAVFHAARRAGLNVISRGS